MLWLDDDLQLHCSDARTGEHLLRPDESRQARRTAESRAQAAETRAQAAETRAQAAETRARDAESRAREAESRTQATERELARLRARSK